MIHTYLITLSDGSAVVHFTLCHANSEAGGKRPSITRQVILGYRLIAYLCENLKCLHRTLNRKIGLKIINILFIYILSRCAIWLFDIRIIKRRTY